MRAGLRFIAAGFGLLGGPLGRALRRLRLARGGEDARRRRDAQRIASGILAELSRLGFTRRVAGTRKRRGAVQRVRFDYPLLLTHDELWMPIDIRRLPVGVRTNDLRDEGVLQSLHDRCHVGVRMDELPTGKLAFVARLGGASFPEAFPIGAFKLASDAPPLAFPLGLDEAGDHRWADLADLPHLLLVGPTNKGKSTFIHVLLTTWISRNRPSDIEIWLADHKGGAELNRYKPLMGTRQQPGIVRRFSYKPEDTIQLLEAAQKELERRLELLRKADASDVDDYARQTGIYMRRIAIVIDEIFFLMLNREKIDVEPGKGAKRGGFTIRDWAEHLFAKIASAGRAPGVHLVIATQKTGKDVLTGLITANFESRVVFGLADMYQSIYLLGGADAEGLPRGRIIFRNMGGELAQLQAPLIKPDQTRLLLNRIARYGPDGGLGRVDEARRMRDDAKLLLTVACEQFDGAFAISRMYQHARVRGVITKERVEEIARRLERDGVLEPGGPRKSRRVARGYFGRAELLDVVYAPDSERPAGGDPTPGYGPDVAGGAPADAGPRDTSGAQQDAEKPPAADGPDTSYDRDHAPGMAPAGRTDPALDADLLEPWAGLFADAGADDAPPDAPPDTLGES